MIEKQFDMNVNGDRQFEVFDPQAGGRTTTVRRGDEADSGDVRAALN
jgi:hypothetical protein